MTLESTNRTIPSATSHSGAVAPLTSSELKGEFFYYTKTLTSQILYYLKPHICCGWRLLCYVPQSGTNGFEYQVYVRLKIKYVLDSNERNCPSLKD